MAPLWTTAQGPVAFCSVLMATQLLPVNPPPPDTLPPSNAAEVPSSACWRSTRSAVVSKFWLPSTTDSVSSWSCSARVNVTEVRLVDGLVLHPSGARNVTVVPAVLSRAPCSWAPTVSCGAGTACETAAGTAHVHAVMTASTAADVLCVTFISVYLSPSRQGHVTISRKCGGNCFPVTPVKHFVYAGELSNGKNPCRISGHARIVLQEWCRTRVVDRVGSAPGLSRLPRPGRARPHRGSRPVRRDS